MLAASITTDGEWQWLEAKCSVFVTSPVPFCCPSILLQKSSCIKQWKTDTSLFLPARYTEVPRFFQTAAEDGVLQAESSPHPQPPSPGGCSRIAWWRWTPCPQHIHVSPECHCVPWWLIEEVMLEGSTVQSHQASVCTLCWGERLCLAPWILPSYAQLQLVSWSFETIPAVSCSHQIIYAMEMVTASPALLPAPFWFYPHGCPLPQL